ncbi:hypothetical protein I6F33_34325 [Bradyrhizobium sp. BRP20]|uniref:hypothetical protein n=1 Tax=unclassified Bradyrhizobium TaxID=2631580 RepID=UPI001CD742E9|nr:MULTISPECIES: hypothetical protein [unclassified Bradyrhizobium]MCA1437994.1 hypothetical protein [Bradyrhizobium sp. BRP20]MCA1552165.1 hypothetical protein [Bradyrhizobium sp. BRP19]
MRVSTLHFDNSPVFMRPSIAADEHPHHREIGHRRFRETPLERVGQSALRLRLLRIR